MTIIQQQMPKFSKGDFVRVETSADPGVAPGLIGIIARSEPAGQAMTYMVWFGPSKFAPFYEDELTEAFQ